MNTVKVPLQHSPYPVYIGSGVVEKLGPLLLRHFKGRRVALITHAHLYELHGKKLVVSLKKQGLDVQYFFVPDGEKSKSLTQLSKLYDSLASRYFQRDSAILALGGGVIGDLAGFCASTYMRGVSLFHVPTTVVAQADSSIGGKTGINHAFAKNLIGAFYQPRAVFCDVRLLRTLPQREYVSGLAEVVKYGMIYDRRFLSFLENNVNAVLERDEKALSRVIMRCAEIKADVVSKDEKEKNLRMILNYGHTLGHAIETSTEYASLLHGEAVAWGMVFAARLSRERAGFTQKDEERQNVLLRDFSLIRPLKKPQRMKEFLSLLLLDKKARKGKVRFVLLKDVGKTSVVDDIPSSLIRRTVSETLWKDSV